MCEKSSNSDRSKVASALQRANSIVLVTHVHPDGDALGSMAALARAATTAGKTADAIACDDLPWRYDFLVADWKPSPRSRFAELADKADVICVIDTCATSQLGDLAEPILARKDKVVVIDHHTTPDEIGATQWTDSSAAAAGVMIGELLDELAWPIDLPIAEALATAILTDTGWLRFSNTDGRCLRQFARLVDAGVQTDTLYRRLYERDRAERTRLMARMLTGMELHCDGRLAVMTIRQSDFAETGARPSETENLINEALRIDSVAAVVLLVEQADMIRASLRSRGEFNVAEVASQFGGGGHARAAGCKRPGDLDEFKQLLTDACRKALG